MALLTMLLAMCNKPVRAVSNPLLEGWMRLSRKFSRRERDLWKYVLAHPVAGGATGDTTTGSLADSLEIVIDSARLRREYPPIVVKVSERHKLTDNTGLAWNEIEVSRQVAQDVTETTLLENPQQWSDILASVTPTISGITTVVTDRTMRRITKETIAQLGSGMQDAIERKKDLDGLVTIDGATASQPGAGATMTSGVISSHVANITGNTTEGAQGAIHTVWHPFQQKDVQDEIVAGIGTYTVPEGITEEFFRSGFQGTLFGTNVWLDGNITIDSLDDAKGGTFAQMGLLYVQGADLSHETKRRPELGGGADQVWLYDEYAFAERLSNSTSVFIREIFSDATAPTT